MNWYVITVSKYICSQDCECDASFNVRIRAKDAQDAMLKLRPEFPNWYFHKPLKIDEPCR